MRDELFPPRSAFGFGCRCDGRWGWRFGRLRSRSSFSPSVRAGADLVQGRSDRSRGGKKGHHTSRDEQVEIIHDDPG